MEDADNRLRTIFIILLFWYKLRTGIIQTCYGPVDGGNIHWIMTYYIQSNFLSKQPDLFNVLKVIKFF